MKFAAILLQSLGVFALLTGLVWMGQGTGYIPFPSRSFMIDQREWVWIGAGIGFAGLGLIAFANRRH